MNINGTTLIAIVTAPLIIGSLLGAPYQTRPNPKAAAAAPDPTHSNYIRIEIRPGTKVAVVAPEVGDTVEWYPQATNANPNPLPATVSSRENPHAPDIIPVIRFQPARSQPAETSSTIVCHPAPVWILAWTREAKPEPSYWQCQHPVEAVLPHPLPLLPFALPLLRLLWQTDRQIYRL